MEREEKKTSKEFKVDFVLFYHLGDGAESSVMDQDQREVVGPVWLIRMG